MRLPKVVLFDMDNTLVDHEYASVEALAHVRASIQELKEYDMATVRELWGRDFDRYWIPLIKGELTMEENWKLRFARMFDSLGKKTDSGVSERAAKEYGNKYMSNIIAVPGAGELLALLKQKGIRVGIVTNNIERMQSTKMRNCGFEPLVDYAVTSESCGIMKPDPQIFNIALTRFGVEPEDAVMVGDSLENDVIGGLKSGIPSVWFNRGGSNGGRKDINVPVLEDFRPVESAYRIITEAGNNGFSHII